MELKANEPKKAVTGKDTEPGRRLREHKSPIPGVKGWMKGKRDRA